MILPEDLLHRTDYLLMQLEDEIGVVLQVQWDSEAAGTEDRISKTGVLD